MHACYYVLWVKTVHSLTDRGYTLLIVNEFFRKFHAKAWEIPTGIHTTDQLNLQ